MPAIAMTRGMRRKPVFLVGILGFLAANLITTFSRDIRALPGSRAGCGGILRPAGGHARRHRGRITAPVHAGRALSVASPGTPVGLAVGTPFGSWLGRPSTGARPSA